MIGAVHLDFKALEMAAQYEGGFTPEHPTIKNLWQVVNALPIAEKKKFLKFVTGSDRAPVGGLGNLKITVQRDGGGDSYRLPQTHTCFNTLVLPEYGSRGKMADRLKTALEYAAEGFGLQ